VHIHRIGLIKRIRLISPLLFWINSVRLIKSIDPDLVHSQGIGVGMPAYMAKKLLGKRYIIWAHNSQDYWFIKIPLISFKKIGSYFLRIIIKNSDRVIVLTDIMKNEMVNFFNRDVTIIPNGVDVDRFENFRKCDTLEKKNIVTVLWVGVFRPEKGVQYLIEAIKYIIAVNKNVNLLLIGYGSEENQLRGLVKELSLEEYVHFIGKVSNDRIPEYMATSDVFVLPSLSEGFPVVILEAMAAGLPIVASWVEGLPEIIKEGENGFLVSPRNSHEIAEKVLLLIQNDSLRDKICKNNKNKSLSFSWDNIILEIEKVYAS
jgi:glycosyltransferase involved in cell wall biosynthesis